MVGFIEPVGTINGTITVVDDLGNPISGATVLVTFTGDYNETVAGTTNGSGSVTLQTVGVKKGNIDYTFCVDSVSAGLPYAPGDNSVTCDNF